MKTLFDIGDEVDITLKGKVIEYSASQSGDCYTIEITDTRNNKSRVYLDSNNLKTATLIRMRNPLFEDFGGPYEKA